jgi:signal transduction histidine kinase/ActR/RegA family two-component response regulator
LPDINRSEKFFICGVALSGLAWGSAGIFLYPVESIIYQTFLTFVLGGMAIGSAVAYAVIMRVYLAYMVPSLTPIIVRFLLSGDEIHLAMGGMSLLFALLITVIAVRINRITNASLSLRLENVSLISHLTSARDDQEKLNESLILEIAERKKTEEALEVHRKHLEELVKEGTVDLTAANTALQQEIGERKRIEERLQEAHKRLLTILDGIDALVYVADMKTYELLFVNKYGRDIWGDIQGKKCWKVLQSGQTAPCDFCTNKYLLDFDGHPQEPYTWEFQNTVNGHWYYICDRAVRWIDGRIVRLEIASDITESKKLVEERQQRHKLESVGILAGGIAHDFNNLLTAIMNNIYLSKRHIDRESSAYSRLELAEKAIGRANDLTHQLLTFSKGGTPVKHSTSITEVIRESADFILRGSNVRSEYAMSDNLWPVEVDVGQISQVFQNLIINADQSMPEGGTIKIHAENAVVHTDTELPLKEGKYVKITIHDQGRGISEEHLPNIFDPYFTTKEMGRGLGLTISFSIIKNHDGHISAESELGRGTTFIIYLPASEKKTAPKEPYESTTFAGTGKILIMDDEELVRSSLGEMIAAFGYEVGLAKDGTEAIKLYKKAMNSPKPFDVVILDLTVPGGMGGKEAIKKLLELDPQVKAIVSSGYTNDPVMANFREYGFSDVIVKPYKLKELRGILTKI